MTKLRHELYSKKEDQAWDHAWRYIKSFQGPPVCDVRPKMMYTPNVIYLELFRKYNSRLHLTTE